MKVKKYNKEAKKERSFQLLTKTEVQKSKQKMIQWFKIQIETKKSELEKHAEKALECYKETYTGRSSRNQQR